MDTIWARTLLSIYPKIDSICKNIDKRVWNLGLGEQYSNMYGSHDVFDKIIKLTQKKIRFINIKVLVDEILNSMPEKYSTILEDNFILDKKVEEIVFTQGISLRTVFRRINSALEDFTCFLNIYGFTKDVLDEKFLKDYHIYQEMRIQIAKTGGGNGT